MSAPATDLDRPRHLLEEMGFEFAPEVLGELAERAVREKLPQLGLLELVLGTERERREERRIKTALKLSGLPVGKTLEGFDYLFQRGVDKSRCGGLLKAVGLWTPPRSSMIPSRLRPNIGRSCTR